MTEILPLGNPELSEALEDHIKGAKGFLLQSNGRAVPMYDHLVEVVKKVLEDKPCSIEDLLKQYSYSEKKSCFRQVVRTFQNTEKFSNESLLASEQQKLFKKMNTKVSDIIHDNEIEDVESPLSRPVPDIMENAYFFELAGVGIGREETLRIFLALKHLSDDLKLKSCRFWGKIFGINRNYIIAEVEFFENEDPEMKEEIKQLQTETIPPVESNETVIADLPKSNYKRTVDIPNEMYGEGCNCKVYYVCNEAGLPWVRLPSVTPKQIQVCRQIKKFMTGDLETDVISYPPFPGNEANFLRAQIARISASTQVSPQGYYVFEEEEDEDEGDVRTAFIENVEYEGTPVSDLCDPSLAFWVHHVQFILPQGRTTWVDPNANPEVGMEEANESESEQEEREEPNDEEPEEGPPLLTPLSEDDDINEMSAWTVVKSTNHFTQYAIAILHSNLWPGAHAFAYDKKFQNIYIGYGIKYEVNNFNPQMPPPLLEEYPSGPDITEAEDPTVEQERAVTAAQKEAMEEEEEAEESEDYDDDN